MDDTRSVIWMRLSKLLLSRFRVGRALALGDSSVAAMRAGRLDNRDSFLGTLATVADFEQLELDKMFEEMTWTSRH
jgi:hypothetical protein